MTDPRPDLLALAEQLQAFAFSKNWHVQKVQGATTLEESITKLNEVRDAAEALRWAHIELEAYRRTGLLMGKMIATAEARISELEARLGEGDEG